MDYIISRGPGNILSICERSTGNYSLASTFHLRLPRWRCATRCNMAYDNNNDDGLQSKPDPLKLHLETVHTDIKVIDGVPVIENRAEKEKVLLRKIDMRMMPLMMVICESCIVVLYLKPEVLT